MLRKFDARRDIAEYRALRMILLLRCLLVIKNDLVTLCSVYGQKRDV